MVQPADVVVLDGALAGRFIAVDGVLPRSLWDVTELASDGDMASDGDVLPRSLWRGIWPGTPALGSLPHAASPIFPSYYQMLRAPF